MSPPDETPPGLPRDGDGPVFAAPWQAQAFALAVKLNEHGLFAWSEFADALAGEIRAAGDSDTGENYYLHWLAALERVVAATNAASAEELAARKDAWDRAARATPHGEPIVLGRAAAE